MAGMHIGHRVYLTCRAPRGTMQGVIVWVDSVRYLVGERGTPGLMGKGTRLVEWDNMG